MKQLLRKLRTRKKKVEIQYCYVDWNEIYIVQDAWKVYDSTPGIISSQQMQWEAAGRILWEVCRCKNFQTEFLVRVSKVAEHNTTDTGYMLNGKEVNDMLFLETCLTLIRIS